MITKNEIVEMYNQGISGSAIARKLGRSPSYVYDQLHAAGIWTRAGVGGARFSLSDTQMQEVADLYRAKWSMRKLAARFHRCEETIARALQKMGVELRHDVGGPLRHFSDAQAQDIVASSRKGEPQSSIARRYETALFIINRLLLQLGETPVRHKAMGSSHGLWKGGRIVVEGGYVLVKVRSESPFASMRNSGGYVPEHRLVMAERLGRPLKRHETVHHVNGSKQDNRPENLQLRIGNHGKGEVYRCADCGSHNIETVPIASVRRGMLV